MVTIYDIAKATGFSAPTISKALNGKGAFSDETRKLILETAKKMGYSPNVSARTLTTRKSNLIGVIYDDTGMNKGFAHPLFSVVLNRFREQVEYAGYDLIFLSRFSKMSYSAHAKHRSVDGVIIINPATGNVDEFKEFIDENIPRVSTNCLFNGICTIISDNEKGGYIATRNFIENGHTKIAFLSAPHKGISSAPQERFAGYERALKESNIPFDKDLYIESELWAKEGGKAAFEKLYKSGKDFTAIFCATDQLASGVYEYAEEHNIKIPDEISVIGFDDEAASAFMFPHLTTFRQDAIKIADLAAEMILQQIAGIPVPEVVRCDAEFLQRQSVKKIR